MNGDNCPVCNSRLKTPKQTTFPATRAVFVRCPRCGPFIVAFEVLSSFKQDRIEKWAIVSHAIRRLSTEDAPYTVKTAWLQWIIDRETFPRPQEQADTMISILGEKSSASGRWIACNPHGLAGLLGTDDDPRDGVTAGVHYIVERLKNKNLIEQQTPMSADDGSMPYRLTFDGWERFDELRRGAIDSRIAFMAMKFGNEELDRAFAAFMGAVGQTGYELRRLDQKPQAGLIDLRMRVEIRSAKFLVAELTDENRGAYWEAGFDEGLGKKVYYTCEASKFEKVKTHFDTEHMLTVKWNPEDMTPALDELKSAIRNDFPTDAVQSDAQ
jgi:hypothetical protein